MAAATEQQKNTKRQMKLSEYIAEGEQLFGKDRLQWKFVCPICQHVASAEDYRKAGAPEGAVGFSCIGRYLPKEQIRSAINGQGNGPCDYTTGGLFNLSPVKITDHNAYFFDFAKPEVKQ
jgi:hypothetical protein